MRAGLRLIAAVCAAIACAGFGAPHRIDYTLTPVMTDGALTAVQVDLRFQGQGDGETGLRLPDEWGGQPELWRGIQDLTVVSGAQMRDGERINERVLTHRPNGSIHIRYRIIQDWDGVPNAQQGNSYRPVIQPGYFHLIGDAALVTPELHLATPVRMRTRAMPRGWAFASDLQHSGLVLGDAWASVTVGGDFRILRAADRNIRVAIRGDDWSFTDESITARVAEIVSGHRRFWNDPSTPYLVTVLPITAPTPGWLSIGGTGLNDAFAFFATNNAEERQIVRTLAHESFHTWIPGRIGGMPDENEATSYWLSEGFTDFYTARMLVREGLWSSADYAADLNEALSEYARSPMRAAPNAQVAAEFWANRDAQRMPYIRGRMLGLLWDARLRDQGRNLDDVVWEMRARAQAGDPLKVVDMAPLVFEQMGLDVRPDIATHIDAGAPLTLPEDLLAPCGRIVTREVANFHRGFDIEATQANGNVISSVDPALPAYAAGLRDGMILVRRDGGEIGNAELEIGYVVRDGETERTIRYMPRGQGTHTLQRLELDETLDGERTEQCRAVLAG